MAKPRGFSSVAVLLLATSHNLCGPESPPWCWEVGETACVSGSRSQIRLKVSKSGRIKKCTFRFKVDFHFSLRYWPKINTILHFGMPVYSTLYSHTHTSVAHAFLQVLGRVQGNLGNKHNQPLQQRSWSSSVKRCGVIVILRLGGEGDASKSENHRAGVCVIFTAPLVQTRIRGKLHKPWMYTLVNMLLDLCALCCQEKIMLEQMSLVSKPPGSESEYRMVQSCASAPPGAGLLVGRVRCAICRAAFKETELIMCQQLCFVLEAQSPISFFINTEQQTAQDLNQQPWQYHGPPPLFSCLLLCWYQRETQQTCAPGSRIRAGFWQMTINKKGTINLERKCCLFPTVTFIDERRN